MFGKQWMRVSRELMPSEPLTLHLGKVQGGIWCHPGCCLSAWQ
jgi:hypothetical protein